MIARVFQRPPFEQWTRARLVDQALERYLDWRLECAALDDAYGVWRDAPAGEAALPFAAYSAALDREQRAAALYGSVIDRIGRPLGEAPGPATDLLGAIRP